MTKQDIINFFEEDEELFIRTIEELDSWTGYLGDDRIYPMWELDEFFGDMKLTEFLNRLGSNFNSGDDYFYYGIYGIESTDCVDYSDFLDEYFVDALLNEYSHLYLDSEVKDILDEYLNEKAEDEE